MSRKNKKPLEFSVQMTLRMNRDIDVDNNEERNIVPGRFTIVSGGEEKTFDFLSGAIYPPEGQDIQLAFSDPDAGYEDTASITAWDLQNISEIRELFVFTGEEGETDMRPVKLLSMDFDVYDEDRGKWLPKIHVPEEVLKNAHLTCNIKEPEMEEVEER